MIDKIVYTYWTNGGTDYKLGFLNTDNMLHVFRKSIEEAYKQVSTVVVYCDQEGYDFLFDKIDPDFVIVDYSQYEFDSRYWNFPKLITYNLQEEPFLHVDIDAIVFNFDKEGDVVSESKRGVYYDTSIYPSLEDKKELLTYFKGWLTCSGILGGNNTTIFKDLFEEVKETVKNKDSYIILPKTRMIIEEVVLSSLINKNNITVSYLSKENNDFTHYWGEDKQQNFINYVNSK